MKVLFFGSYDVGAHPRVAVLIEGLRAHLDEVEELNVPLGVATAERVAMVSSPSRLPALISRILTAWRRLLRGASGVAAPDVVIVGYLGHFDVLLARLRFRRATIVLDYLVSGAATAADRGIGSPLVTRALTTLDRLALSAADVIVVDTLEQAERVPERRRSDVVVVPVGATGNWFREPAPRETTRLAVVFFGLFTPLQGTVTIGTALGDLAGDPIDIMMIGSGQDLAACRAAAGSNPNVEWVDWVDGDKLPEVVARHDVSLGIFGTSPKARAVVPTKAFQGAAAGCVVVTSDTEPQRRLLGDAAEYVPPGDSEALAATLRTLAGVDRLEARLRAYRTATQSFAAPEVVAPLVKALRARSR